MDNAEITHADVLLPRILTKKQIEQLEELERIKEKPMWSKKKTRGHRPRNPRRPK